MSGRHFKDCRLRGMLSELNEARLELNDMSPTCSQIRPEVRSFALCDDRGRTQRFDLREQRVELPVGFRCGAFVFADCTLDFFDLGFCGGGLRANVVSVRIGARRFYSFDAAGLDLINRLP